jgi:hypothetical protein
MRTQSAEFLAMGSRESLENLGSSTAEFHKDFAPVLEIILPFNQFLRGETVNQFDGCMMNDLELLCQFTDGYTFSLRETFDGKQGLILARSETSDLSGFFTELEESPKAIAECCEQSVLGFSEARRNSSGGSGHLIVRIRLSSACSSKCYVLMRYIFAVVVPMSNSCSPSHVHRGFSECFPGGRLTIGRNLQGCSNCVKEAAHLRDVRHDLAKIHCHLQLPQTDVAWCKLFVR